LLTDDRATRYRVVVLTTLPRQRDCSPTIEPHATA